MQLGSMQAYLFSSNLARLVEDGNPWVIEQMKRKLASSAENWIYDDRFGSKSTLGDISSTFRLSSCGICGCYQARFPESFDKFSPGLLKFLCFQIVGKTNRYTFRFGKNAFDLSIGPFNGVDDRTSLVYELSTGFVGTGLYADGLVIRIKIGTFAPRVQLLQSCIDV